jgi:hypothetical protein
MEKLGVKNRTGGRLGVTEFLERRRSSMKDRKADFWWLENTESTDRKRGGGAILVERGKKLSEGE